MAAPMWQPHRSWSRRHDPRGGVFHVGAFAGDTVHLANLSHNEARL